MDNWIMQLTQADAAYIRVFQEILRYGVPALTALLLFLCIRPLLTFHREPEIWAWLILKDERRLPITHWESVIGRNKRSDVVMNVPTISRNHAVLTRYDDGSWTIADAGSKAGVYVNGKRIRIAALELDDVISICGIEMKLLPISRRQEINWQSCAPKHRTPSAALSAFCF